MLNRAQIIGRLGRDPESHAFPGGGQVCNFTVATTEKWKDKQTGEAKEETTWHRVNAFGRLAQVCGDYLRSGSLVYVEGRMTQRKWTDKSGVERISHEIAAQSMQMLGGRSEAAQPAAATTRPAPQPAAQATHDSFSDIEDDVSF